jgi:cysteine sulfinate desulfinase/cysteine desulfurase-like protein
LWRPMDPIYLDANATTPLLPAVWDAMRPTR